MSEQENAGSQDQPQDIWAPTGDRPLTYYDILDLDRDATQDDIRAAYHYLARRYHPDVVGNDPEAAQRFALINEAYRVLSDTQRRYQYDRTLPRKSYPLRHPTPQKIWQEATEVVLIRSDRFGPLNQAMQATVPVTLDGDLLVLTIPGPERHLAGHLETASHRNAILNALELVCGRRIDYRMIDGNTVDDWEALKRAEARARETAAPATGAGQAGAAGAARPAAVGETPWDEVIQRMHRTYQHLPRRQYPQTKARFLRDALGWIARVDEDQRFDAQNEEAHERALARTLERLAAILDLPAVVVAIQLESLRRAGEV